MRCRNHPRYCRAKHQIRSHHGSIAAGCRGTIQGEIENLGRHLIAVQWENGPSMYVFPDEIAIDTDENAQRRDARLEPA